MSFHVKYDDVTAFGFYANGKMREWRSQLQELSAAFAKITEMESFRGEAAAGVKNYLAQVHMTAIASLTEVLNEFGARFLLYKDGYYSIDDDPHAKIEETKLEELLRFYANSGPDFAVQHQKVKAAAESVSDIVSCYPPDSQSVSADYRNTQDRLLKLRNDINSYEQQHTGSDFANLESLISALGSFLTEYGGNNAVSAVNYRNGDVLNARSADALASALETSYNGRAALTSALEAAGEREQLRYAVLEQELAADERAREGRNQAIKGGLMIAGGVLVAVFTFGIGVPASVAMIAVGVTAFGAAAYGAYEMTEGLQDAYYGSIGDNTAYAVNGMRDGLFLGNQQAYDAFGNTCVLAGSILVFPAGGAYFGAASATRIGMTTARYYSEVAGMMSMTGVSAAVDAGGYYGSKALGADERTARIIGTVAGIGAGIGVGLKMPSAGIADDVSRIPSRETPIGGYATKIDSQVTQIQRAKLPENVINLNSANSCQKHFLSL